MSQLASRRAIESLRSGVPSPDAVRLLPTYQPVIERRFLEALELGLRPSDGFLIAAPFGAGKTHLLERLRVHALDRNWAVAFLPVSKELPLGQLDKVYQRIASDVEFPGSLPRGLGEAVERLDTRSAPYVRMYNSITAPDSIYEPQFVASMLLHSHGHFDWTVRRLLLRFWSGDPVQAGEWRPLLREYFIDYRPQASSKATLARNALSFVGELLVAAGFSGLLVLVDELELIARYGPVSRARSYATIARLFGKSGAAPVAHLVTVAAMTDDFADTVRDRGDPEFLRTHLSRSPDLIAEAQLGLEAVLGGGLPFRSVPQESMGALGESVRAVYQDAYSVEVPRPDFAVSGPLRTRIRAWVTYWDLYRLYGLQQAVSAIPVSPSLNSADDFEDGESDG